MGQNSGSGHSVEKLSLEGLSSESAGGEVDRIRIAYAKRQSGTRYSWFSPAYLFMIQERERRLLALLKRHNFPLLDTKKILEVGCGTGYWLHEFVKWGARPENITGVDLLAERVDEARRLLPQRIKIHCCNATELAFDDGTFDLVLQSTVFSSVLDISMKEKMAGEILRVVKREGLILWYDFYINNPWNPDVKAVKKREIHQLFPGCQIELRHTTLAPPLTRLIAPYSWLACYLLEKIPLLCTHYLGVIRK